ncbi:uncharacterized protein [Montipora capricornis]|uniref:uncharacterized protein n=1 Tax=Montipora capricornis TaxID=246305 RepID=UPI0035F10E0E
MVDETFETPPLHQKNSVIDFPPAGLLEAVISSFPRQWRGVFSSLNSEDLAVQAGSFWLQQKSVNEKLSDISPNFIDFIDHLVSDFPVVLNDKLFFKPKILLLPLNMQRNTLAFIDCHSFSLPSQCLEKLVNCLKKCVPELNNWRLTYLKILESRVKDSREGRNLDSQNREQNSCQENYWDCGNLLTEESITRFENLVERNINAESSKDFPLLSNFFDRKVPDGMANNYWNKPEQCLLSQGFIAKDGCNDDVKIVGLTGAGSQDEDVNGETLQESLYQRECEVVNESYSEISKVPENTARREMVLTPPPECLIIRDEDLLEQSEFDTKASVDMPMKEQENDQLLTDFFNENFMALKELIQRLEGGEKDTSNELKVFASCSCLEIESICSQLNLDEVQESTTISMCQKFVNSIEASFGNASVFARYCILPKIQELKQAASRDLFSAISQFAKKYSRAFCDGVVTRLMQRSNLDNAQVVLVNKMIKECLNGETRLYLLQLVISIKISSNGCSFSWTEDTVSVVQTVVDLKPELDDDLFGTFSNVLEQQSHNLSKSVKFSKLLLAVIKSYGKQVSVLVNCFMRIFDGNETFLKKAGFAALKKIATN